MTDEGITIDDIAESMRGVAELIGVEQTIQLSEHFGGITLTIPQMHNLLRPMRYEAILKDYLSGMDPQELALKHKVSQATVYRLINERLGGTKKRHITVDGQMSFEDFFGDE
ncbi:MAG: hypothetical protein IJ079_03810 [Lachnospiraceae bacterium]|nr:hypothetical protein [Lachnospiraceae bacterium]MBR1567534.1 hypothetical protein [Lachnospiraceae bacterium]MBR1568690.1 hypothetical protein [Lachnospiraceae bacterium]